MIRPSAISTTWRAQGAPPARYCPKAGIPFAVSGTGREPWQPRPGPRRNAGTSARPRRQSE
ncbi:hypothetical protein [Streptomyces noursei]|uniref:hypothetical protein n=1 Tax=Streptomyces noursei TaxID=1971 RepID=UPI0027E33C31|nr:hypothetical protein [Streptomyces noursei]